MNTKLYKRICVYVREKIAGTKWEGHVFTVGGCCRDMVLGSEINDVDFVVDLPGGGIEFADWLRSKRLTIGSPVKFEKYGTAMTRLKAYPHDNIEMVQTRAEKYTDRNSRNPETAFGSLKEDCFRRDLTINALYYDISNNRVIDITGRGLDDIRNRVICTPSDPDSTYDDDPIRILRTIRFATRLGWELPEYIFESMMRNVHRLTIIKPERMRGEFEKILFGCNPAAALNLIEKCGALKYVIPQLEMLVKTGDANLWYRTLDAMRNLKDNTPAVRMAVLIHAFQLIDGMKPKQLKAVMVQALMSLKYHNPFIKETLLLAVHALDSENWGSHAELMKDADLRRLQYTCGKPERMTMLLNVMEAVQKSHLPQQADAIRMRMAEFARQGSEMYTYHLPFAERRIKKLLNIQPGPLVEDTLRYMMDLAFINPLRSKQEFERLVSAYTPVAGSFPASVSRHNHASCNASPAGKRPFDRRDRRKGRKSPAKEKSVGEKK